MTFARFLWRAWVGATLPVAGLWLVALNAGKGDMCVGAIAMMATGVWSVFLVAWLFARYTHWIVGAAILGVACLLFPPAIAVVAVVYVIGFILTIWWVPIGIGDDDIAVKDTQAKAARRHVRECLRQGFSCESIARQLSQAGWAAEEVSELIADLDDRTGRRPS